MITNFICLSVSLLIIYCVFMLLRLIGESSKWKSTLLCLIPAIIALFYIFQSVIPITFYCREDENEKYINGNFSSKGKLFLGGTFNHSDKVQNSLKDADIYDRICISLNDNLTLADYLSMPFSDSWFSIEAKSNTGVLNVKSSDLRLIPMTVELEKSSDDVNTNWYIEYDNIFYHIDYDNVKVIELNNNVDYSIKYAINSDCKISDLSGDYNAYDYAHITKESGK